MSSAPDQEIFLFPLHTVLFPEGILALKIFEQRYLEMTKSCLRDNKPFGVCLIREGREVGPPALPEPVGCTATITQWDMPQLGVFHIVARGGSRFRIVETRTAKNGLITGSVRPLPDEGGSSEIDDTCRDILKTAMEKAGPAHFPDPIKLDDGAWVAYRLAEILPIDAPTKQHLLELPDAGARLRRLRELLQRQGLAG